MDNKKCEQRKSIIETEIKMTMPSEIKTSLFETIIFSIFFYHLLHIMIEKYLLTMI